MNRESELSADFTFRPVAPRAERRAVIDVGTNSVKLLVADVTPDEVIPVWEGSEQTRLGRGFYDTHRLQSDAIAATATAIATFVATASQAGATHLRVIATSAARDAINAQDLTNAIQQEAKVKLEIISGAQEADYAYQGVCTNPALANAALLLLDVGGGSTEFIVGASGRTQFRESYQLGTVRLMERFIVSDPPAAEELSRCRAQVRSFLEQTVAPHLAPFLRRQPSLQLVGTGGTTTVLARMERNLATYDRVLIEATVIPAAQVTRRVEQLWSLPLAARKTQVGLPPNRADVILFGAVIYEAILDVFGLPDLRISTRGMRYAALLP